MGNESRNWSNIAFALLFLGVLALFLVVVGPFLLPVLMAAFVVALLYPMNDKITSWLKGRRRVASFVSTFLVFLGIVVPVGGLLYLFFLQAIDLVGEAEKLLGPDGLGGLLGGDVPEPLVPVVEVLEGWGVQEQLSRFVSASATFLARNLGSIFSTTANLVIALFLAFISFYYFFADGHRIVREIHAVSPLESPYLDQFFAEVRNVSQTMIVVNLLTGLAQGAAGAIGFVIVGFPSPVVWAALMALFSFVPMVGTGLIWVPAGVALLLGGQVWEGIFLLAWGTVVVGSVDNLLRPLLAKGRMDLHPLLVFLTIFGGLAAFGFLGVILGPMIGSIFTAMIRIWKNDFVPRFFPRDEPGA